MDRTYSRDRTWMDNVQQIWNSAMEKDGVWDWKAPEEDGVVPVAVAVPVPVAVAAPNFVRVVQKRVADNRDSEEQARKVKKLKSAATSATKKWLQQGRRDAQKRVNEDID